jgi:nucleotide-binding universal stress UspA family protein
MKVIIVPTDFSENAANAVKYAVQMSKLHYYKLIFVHVYSLPFLNPEAGMVYDEALSDSLRLQADKALREHIEKVYESMEMNRNLLLSELEVTEAISLSSGIEKIHQKYNANMIIMGTHGATGLKKFFLGSNAVDVLENVDIPMLSIPEHCKYKEIKQVTYACDLNDIDAELKEVVNFAKSYTAQVNVVHVAKDNMLDKVIEVDSVINKWQQETGYKKINLHLIQSAENSDIDKAIKTLLHQIDSDIVIMFHKQRNFWKSIFEKSTTAELVYEWPAPVLSMHKK